MALRVEPATQVAVTHWYNAVNCGDPDQAAAAVTDPIVVLGPRGAGPISPDELADWVRHTGVRLAPRQWRPISNRLVVVEEDAYWPDNSIERVATVYRSTGTRVSASLRLPDLASALEVSYILREMLLTH